MHEMHVCRYQRLLAQEYDRKLKEAKRNGKIRFNVHETVDGQTIEGHTSQSSLMGGERSTPSVSNSGFNYNDFVTETGHSAASGMHVFCHWHQPRPRASRFGFVTSIPRNSATNWCKAHNIHQLLPIRTSRNYYPYLPVTRTMSSV